MLIVFCLPLQGWSASGKVSLRSESSHLSSPTSRCSNLAMLKPRASTCACCHASWPTPSSMAVTWRSLANSCPTPSYTPPPPWKTAPPWHSGSTTWRRGPLPGGTHWKGLLLLGHTTTTTNPRLHPPSPHPDPPPPLTPLLQAIPTPCITTSATARTTASTGGRAAQGIRGWAEAGISSSRAVRTGTSFCTRHPLCRQPSTRLELVDAATWVSEVSSVLLLCSANFWSREALTHKVGMCGWFSALDNVINNNLMQ